MKKICPQCNQRTFSYWELFPPYPIKDFTTPCRNCSAEVYPKEILTILPMYLTLVCLGLNIAYLAISISLGIYEIQRYYVTLKHLSSLLAILFISRLLDIRIFDLTIDREEKNKV